MVNRTLGDLTPGTHVWIDETVDGVTTLVEYWLLEVGAQSCVLLRQDAAMEKRMHSSDNATYADAIEENGGTGAVCEMDKYLCDPVNGWMSRYDDATKACLVAREIKWIDVNRVYGDDSNITLTRRCYLLSGTELGLSTKPDEGASYLNAMKTAKGTTSEYVARVALGNSSSAKYWWTRSSYSNTHFQSVKPNGYPYDYAASSGLTWLRPALSVASATYVSPEGETKICLLPDPDKPYREMSGTAIFGESKKRPKEMIFSAELANLYDTSFEVCNNAGDASPAWVGATPGNRVTLCNQTKNTENWEIGLKFYGKSGSIGKMSLPIMTVLTEDK